MARPAGDAEEAADSGPRGARRRPQGAGLLVALAVVALLGLALQTARVRTLSSEVEALTGELFTARAALSAYDARFQEVRVDRGRPPGAIRRAGAALVASDPLAEVPEASTGSPFWQRRPAEAILAPPNSP